MTTLLVGGFFTLDPKFRFSHLILEVADQKWHALTAEAVMFATPADRAHELASG